jgi:GR25 family glycosyltransferase involved in LPS biosynthesis/glycosyltransferase involved in cell wall biosynthesis
VNIVFHVGYFSNHWNANTGAPGGSEQCVISLSEELAKLGHTVYVFGEVIPIRTNNLIGSVTYCSLEQKSNIPHHIDVLIGVGYLHYLKPFEGFKVDRKVFWLHNEEPYFWYNGLKMSESDIESALSSTDRFVCLTKWHKNDFLKRYPVLDKKVSIVGNGIDARKIRVGKTKITGSHIYASHAERGLSKVLDDFETGVIAGHLHICTPKYGLEYLELHFLDRISKNPNIVYHGALSQEELYELLSVMQYWYYPTQYNETYCITAIEMLAHHVIPMVNPIAGLADTLREFAYSVDCWSCVDDYVNTRFWSNVVKEWESLFYEIQNQQTMNISGLQVGSVEYTPAKIAIENDVDKAYIICLNPTNEKKSELIERFYSSGIKAKEVVVFEATNGYTNRFMPAGTKAWPGWKINSDNSWWNRDILPGEIGCAASHWRIWKDAQSHRHSKILILEEDFTIIRPFNREAVNTSEEWTIMYLGHSFVNQPVRTVTANLVQPGYTYTTHAYMLTDEGCRLLLEQNYLWSIIPLDEFLSATFCDHPRKDLSWIWRDSKALAVVPSFFGQSSTKETSTTENQPISSKMNLSNYTYEEFVKRFVTYSAKTKEWELIVDEPINDVFIFPLFTEEFCSLLIEQAEESQKWTKNRHYFYPTCDMLINELGLQSHYQRILQEFVYPVAIQKWALEGKEWPVLSSENFIIKYDESVQGHLALHHDSADISMVLALNDDYEGGGTYFWRQKELHKGKTGYISIHPSVITHRHGARAVTKGKRFVLVSFCNKPKK